MRVVELAMANPVPYPSTPNQDKPTLTIESPRDGATYNDTDVFLNFTVTKPDSWYDPQWLFIPYIGQLGAVEAYIDGNSFNYGHNNCIYFGNSASYSIKINQSASGLHMLNVTVLSYTYYRGPAYNGSHILSSIQSSSGPVYKYPITVSDVVYFTVEEPAQSSSPKPINSNYSLDQAFYAATVIAAVIVVVLISLVYVRKTKLTSVKNRD